MKTLWILMLFALMFAGCTKVSEMAQVGVQKSQEELEKSKKEVELLSAKADQTSKYADCVLNAETDEKMEKCKELKPK